jgi:hypothetical protein
MSGSVRELSALDPHVSGRKYFRVENQDSKSHEEFTAYLSEQKAEVERLRVSGESDALYVTKYPKGKRSLMYVFEGLSSPDEPGFVIPAHYFQFRDFMPEALRLRDEKYFEYYPAGQSEHRMRKDRRREADSLYHRYLSYDGLCACLELNEILDDAGAARLDAHYTFLGKFLHPTHDAARRLHVNNNYFNRETAIGISQEYAEEAVLLAALYVAYLLAGIFDEIAGMVESAPKKYIESAGTHELRVLTEAVPRRFPYFWFLFNRPPLWDKFNYAIHHIGDRELADYGGYQNVPDALVPFDSDVYGHLDSAVSAWSANRVGAYKSPLPDRNAAPKFIFGYPVPQRK